MQLKFYPKIFKYLILILLHDFLIPSSYNIYGYILDLKTQNQLSDVNIYSKDLGQGTISDNDGYFNLIFELKPFENGRVGLPSKKSFF